MRQRNSHDQMLPLSKRMSSAQLASRAKRIAARVGAPRREPVWFPQRRILTLNQVVRDKAKRDWS